MITALSRDNRSLNPNSRQTPPAKLMASQPWRDTPTEPDDACCRSGFSSRSSHWFAPAQCGAPASRPFRCSKHRRRAPHEPEPSNGFCLPASTGWSAACYNGPCGGPDSSDLCPLTLPQSVPIDKRGLPTPPIPCCLDRGYPNSPSLILTPVRRFWRRQSACSVIFCLWTAARIGA